MTQQLGSGKSVIGLQLIAAALLLVGGVALPLSVFWTVAPFLTRDPFGYSVLGPLVGIPTFVLSVVALRYAWRLRMQARAEATSDTSELWQRQRRFLRLIIFAIGVLWLISAGGCLLFWLGLAAIVGEPQAHVDPVDVIVKGFVILVIGIVIFALGQAIADAKPREK